MVLPTGLSGGETGHIAHHNTLHAGHNSRIANRQFVFVDGANGNDSNDGSSLYEAKATIAAGIAALVQGSTLVIAPGVYNQSSQLTIPNLRGLTITSLWNVAPAYTNNSNDGYGVVIKATGTNGFTLVRVNTSASQYQQGPKFSGITFLDGTTNLNSTLLHLHNTNRWDLERCNFIAPNSSSSTIGILMTRETGGDNAWNNIYSCNFHYLGQAMNVQRSYGFKDYGSTIVGGGTDAIKIDGPSQHIKFFGTMLDSAQLHSQGFHIGLFGMKFEAQGSTYPMLRVTEDPAPFGSGTRHMVFGNSFVGSGASEIGIQLESGAVNGHYVGNTYVAVPSPFINNSGGRNVILGDSEGIITATPATLSALISDLQDIGILP